MEFYVDGSPTYQNEKDSIQVGLPESYRNTKFSNVTISIPAKDDYAVLTLCEVQVYLGKWITCRAKCICDIKKVREKSRECQNHNPNPFPGTKRKRKTDKTKQVQIEQTYEKH